MITANCRGDFQSPETEVLGKAMMRAITNRKHAMNLEQLMNDYRKL